KANGDGGAGRGRAVWRFAAVQPGARIRGRCDGTPLHGSGRLRSAGSGFVLGENGAGRWRPAAGIYVDPSVARHARRATPSTHAQSAGSVFGERCGGYDRAVASLI